MASDHVVHVVILAQVQLQQIDFHFTMLHKHAMLDHLRKTGGGKKKHKLGSSINGFKYA